VLNQEPIVGCCDVGGSTLRVALASRGGRLLARQTFSHAQPDPNETVATIARTVRELSERADVELSAVGAAVPGPLDPQRGIIEFSPNLGWHDFPFVENLFARLGVPVKIDDDANCAALGEQWLGAGKGVRDFLYMIVGTGIGAGLILDGKLYRGARGFAGELGHTTIVPDGPICSCGNRGCVEALAAGPAIVARMKNLRANVKEDLTARDVIALARAGDTLALQAITEAGEYLGIALANATNLLNPEMIALGGGVALDAGELLLTPARRMMRQRALEANANSVRIVPGELNVDAGLLGAARLAWEME
jgi:glucokinase